MLSANIGSFALVVLTLSIPLSSAHAGGCASPCNLKENGACVIKGSQHACEYYLKAEDFIKGAATADKIRVTEQYLKEHNISLDSLKSVTGPKGVIEIVKE